MDVQPPGAGDSLPDGDAFRVRGADEVIGFFG
jgi:hypothetical protein